MGYPVDRWNPPQMEYPVDKWNPLQMESAAYGIPLTSRPMFYIRMVSGLIRIILPYPDRYEFQSNEWNEIVEELYFFPENFQNAVQNSENYDTFNTLEKDKTL